MATIAGKRKLPASFESETPTFLDNAVKRLQLERPALEESRQVDDDDEASEYYDTSNSGRDDFSETGNGADTPATPLSPGRKRFPSEFKTIQCTYPGCGKTFNRPVRLQAHLRSHTNERPYVCQYEGCDKSYMEDKHLQRHIKGSHIQEKTYVCDWEGCTKSFLTGTRLRRHKEAHQGRDTFRCTAYPPCNQTFRKHQTLQRHIRTDHLELAPFPCTYVDPVTKVPCNAGFDGAGGLRKHEERVHAAPRFVCDSCIMPNSFNPDGTPQKLGFTSDSQLKTHIRKEHANCLFCDLKCSSQRELQKHIETKHSGKSLEERKTISCTYLGCDKSFTKKSNLTVHIRSTHNGERYICGTFDVSSNFELADFDSDDACGKDFVSKINLEDHVRVAHLGLPSVVNANRKTKSAASSVMDLDLSDSDGDFNPKAKKGKKNRKKPKVSAFDELTGNAYFNDPRRTIPCPVPDCAYKLMREYDLQIHMQTNHPGISATPTTGLLVASNIAPVQNSTMPNQQGLGHEITTQGPDHLPADVDWNLEQRALEGGVFWVGADDHMPSRAQNQSIWMQEEAEMRSLIGGDAEYNFIDPELMRM